jgi:hypothetical protein
MVMFEPEALKAQAAADTGLSAFGAEPLDDGLSAFCAALNAEAGLNAAGVAAAQRGIVATLSERLRVEDWLGRHPEILEQTLAPQVFVVGLPRTGTTALSQFLSEDPAARSIRRWEVGALTPPPDAAIAVDPRLLATREAFVARDKAMPTLKTMLPVEAEDPSEHGPLLGLTFRNLQLPSLYDVPSYVDWLLAADMTPAYAYFAKALKLLQWKTPGAVWNLKNPPDIFALEAMKTVFPNALFVWTHRDPANSIPSVCSLTALLRGPTVDHLDKPAQMRAMLRFQAEGVRRALAARARIGEQSFVDVTQAELARDTIGVIRALYAKLGLAFTRQYEAHLHRRMESRPRAQHGRHAYDPAEYGLSPEQIRAPFADYLRRFKVADPA